MICMRVILDEAQKHMARSDLTDQFSKPAICFWIAVCMRPCTQQAPIVNMTAAQLVYSTLHDHLTEAAWCFGSRLNTPTNS